MASHCVALLTNKVDTLPVKAKGIAVKERWLYYLVMKHNRHYYVRKRTEKDIWQNLYEFALIEMPKPQRIQGIKASKAFKSLINGNSYTITDTSRLYKHKLTHQAIWGKFIDIDIDEPLLSADYQRVSEKELRQLPFSKFISTYLKD